MNATFRVEHRVVSADYGRRAGADITLSVPTDDTGHLPIELVSEDRIFDEVAGINWGYLIDGNSQRYRKVTLFAGSWVELSQLIDETIEVAVNKLKEAVDNYQTLMSGKPVDYTTHIELFGEPAPSPVMPAQAKTIGDLTDEEFNDLQHEMQSEFGFTALPCGSAAFWLKNTLLPKLRAKYSGWKDASQAGKFDAAMRMAEEIRDSEGDGRLNGWIDWAINHEGIPF